MTRSSNSKRILSDIFAFYFAAKSTSSNLRHEDMKHWYLQSFFQVSLSMLSGPHWLSGTPPPPHARGGYHMISTLINSMCISTYSRVQCKRSHKSFTKTKLRFHTLVDQELAFDKKGGYRRVKAAVKLTNGPWKFFPNAVVEFDAKIICLQDLASYYSVL